jgi:hypothetical protein
VITADTVQELLCLRSWRESDIIQFDSTMFDNTVQATQIALVADKLAYNNTINLSIQGDDG